MCGRFSICDNGIDQSINNCPHIYEDPSDSGEFVHLAPCIYFYKMHHIYV
jgi:hypothetical protein